MTTSSTLSFSADNAFAKLLNRLVVLLLGTPPTVLDLGSVAGFAQPMATTAPARMMIQGGCDGHA